MIHDAEFVEDDAAPAAPRVRAVTADPVEATARDVAELRQLVSRIADRGRGILQALSKHAGAERRPFLPR